MTDQQAAKLISPRGEPDLENGTEVFGGDEELKEFEDKFEELEDPMDIGTKICLLREQRGWKLKNWPNGLA
jgi:hypothetical protein